jgi:HlyD family secretion protein
LKIADTSAQDVRLAPQDPRRNQLIFASIGIAVIASILFAAPWVKRWANATVSVPYDSASGSITLQVVAGEQVLAGQVLANVDSPELKSQLQQSESALEQRKVELERQRIESRQQALEKRKAADLAEVALTAAKREQRRAHEANELGVIPVIDFEMAQDDLRNAQLAYEHAIADASLFDERLAFELRASEFEVSRQLLFVDDLRRQVDDLAIKSPVDGIVGDLLVDQKSAVSRDTPVMAVVDLSRFEIDALIPESYADDLAIGMRAEILVGGERYAGQLTAVSPEIVNNQVASRIRFLDNGPTNLRQNQRLTTRVLLAEYKDVLMVQRGQFLDSGAGRLAYVINEDRMAERRQIQTGARSLGSVEIIAGLEPGDTIVISNLDPFRGADTVLLTD